MGHNLMEKNGTHAYIGRQPAWHILGDVTGRYLNSDEVFKAANGALDYDVLKDVLYDALGCTVDAWGTFRVDPGSDNPVFLGPVGSGYTVIHHREGFKMTDAMINSVDGAHYETAGALGKGERVWGLADLGLNIRVGGVDEIKPYLSFMTAHDGSMSHQYRTIYTRVVCANTWSAAVGENVTAKLVIRHTKNAPDRLEAAHQALTALRQSVMSVEEKLNYLTTRRMTRESMESIFERLFPKTKREKEGEIVEESSARRDSVLAEVLKLYEVNDGNAFTDFRGSSYNLLNAVTEYTDHFRNPNATAKERAENVMFGSGDVLKSKAFEVIYQTAQKLPEIPGRRSYSSGPGSTGSGLLDSIADQTVSHV